MEVFRKALADLVSQTGLSDLLGMSQGNRPSKAIVAHAHFDPPSGKAMLEILANAAHHAPNVDLRKPASDQRGHNELSVFEPQVFLRVVGLVGLVRNPAVHYSFACPPIGPTIDQDVASRK
jgi:hypothetical protein